MMKIDKDLMGKMYIEMSEINIGIVNESFHLEHEISILEVNEVIDYKKVD